MLRPSFQLFGGRRNILTHQHHDVLLLCTTVNDTDNMAANIERDFINLVDLCPFLAADRDRYDDEAVYAILKKHPRVACLRHSFRCGLGNNIHPLAVIVALGGSLEVIKTMVNACPEALNERLGRRTLLHYIISEGVDIQIIKYLTAQCCPTLISQTDSFGSIPLHLAATYPSSSTCVLRHLLQIYPDGAHALDNRSQTALHRACKSRASLSKVLALIEANPRALFLKDYGKNTPLGWAEKMDHSLTDACPEVVELLTMMEDILTLAHDYGTDMLNDDTTNERKQRAKDILSHFRAMSWYEGIRIAFACNRYLITLIDMQLGLYPTLLSLLAQGNDDCCIGNSFRLESIYVTLLRCPGAFGVD
jgi:hypothetical protein